MNKIVCIVALFVGVIASYGQATLKGKVTNSKGNSLSAVDVLIKGTKKGNSTDNNGLFIINGISKGKYKIEVSMVGFSTKEVEFTITDGEDKTLPTIQLKETSSQLSEVVVKGRLDKTKIPSSSLRLKTELSKVPQNIQVISDDIIESQMIINILDKPFRNVSGVTIREHYGNFVNVFMRGFRVGAFRNGMNVSDGWGPLSEDMAFVDKIEVVKGPSAFMLSAGEPGGLYNVVTKKPTAEKTGKVSLLAGTQDHYRGALDFGGKIGNDERFLFRFNTMYESKGTHLVHQKPATRFGISTSLSAKITPKTEILTEFSFQKLKMIPGGAYIFGDPEKGFASLPRNFSMIDERVPQATMDEMSLLNRLTHSFNENWSVEVKHMLIDYKKKGPTLWGSLKDKLGNATLDISSSDAIAEFNLAQIYINGKFNTGTLSHKVLTGFDYSNKNHWDIWGEDEYLDFNIYNPVYINGPEIKQKISYTNLKNEAHSTDGSTTKSVYIQDEISFLEDKVRFTLAGRYTDLTNRELDEDDVNNNKITPRVGLSVDVLPQITAYALFDQSFMPPDTHVTYRKPGIEYKPILGSIYEGGLKTKLFKDKVRATMSGYHITKTNYALPSDEEIIDPTGKATGEFYQIPDDKVTSKGFEVDIQGKITEELSVILNYAFTDVKDSNETRLAGYAVHTNNAWLTYNFNNKSTLKGFGLSLGYEYQIDRAAWSLNENGKSGLPDYFRLDSSVSWKNDKLRIGLNVNNLLDEYLYAGEQFSWGMDWQTEPGINGRISLTYNLF